MGDRFFLINSLFYKAGLITLDSHHKIKEWKAYANSAGGSVQIHLKTPSDSHLYTQVKDILETFTQKESSPIKHFFTKSEIKSKHHLFGPYSFILEAKDDYVFGDFIGKKDVIPRSDIQGAYKCDHGFLPSHENLKTLLLGKGPNISQGQVIDHCNLVDEGPTFARLLNLEFKSCQGHVIKKFIKEED